MNRKLLFGIAMFFAVLGFALVGAENQAVAGRGGHGHHRARGCFGGGWGAGQCRGAVVYNGGVGCAGAACAGYDCAGRNGCAGVSRCRGRRHHGGLFSRLRARRSRCCGVQPVYCQPVPTCNGVVVGEPVGEPAPPSPPPAPEPADDGDDAVPEAPPVPDEDSV